MSDGRHCVDATVRALRHLQHRIGKDQTEGRRAA